jgi:hypothetical protein
MNIEMKNLTPQQIRRSIDYVNRTQDVWIERYFKFLERCRIEASAQGVVLVHLRDAWRFYGQYRAGADPLVALVRLERDSKSCRGVGTLGTYC